jgi:hypothetical protein
MKIVLKQLKIKKPDFQSGFLLADIPPLVQIGKDNIMGPSNNLQTLNKFLFRLVKS